MVHLHSKQHNKRRYKTFEERMAEIDTARSIVKDLSQRLPETGEIIYSKENESEAINALLKGKYYVEKEMAPSPHSKRRKERIWFDIEPDIVDRVKFDYGQVLNRAITPCWWR